MRRMILTAGMIACLFLTQPLGAAEKPPEVKDGDTLYSLLDGYRGKRITVRIQGGAELTGKIKTLSKELLHLAELSGREYYDAVVPVQKIDSLIVRSREK